jgi:hypothetical protein
MMGRVYTWQEVGGDEYSQERKEEIAAEWNAWEAKSAERKLAKIKEIRLKKLQETDYLALSDQTMTQAMSDYRQGLRDIPQDNTTEEEYDLILAKTGRQLTHAIWSKP